MPSGAKASFDIDPDQTDDFAFAPDGKRLVHVHAQVANSVGIDTVPGRGPQSWSVVPEIEQVEGSGGDLLVPSRDGSRVLYGRGFSQLAVLDGVTGKALPGL